MPEHNYRLYNLFFIYKFQNLDNGKVYIGRTQNPRERAYSHFYGLQGKKSHPNKLMVKDAECKFDFEIIDQADGLIEASEKEKYYMHLYKSYDEQYGYNCNDSMVQTTRKKKGMSYRPVNANERRRT